MTAALIHRTGHRLPIDSIKIEGRHRTNMGDIDGLADSIANLGFLNPILVDGQHRLIAGERRIEAARRLGLQTVPVTIADDLEDVAAALAAERDENTCRKDFTPSEAIALGMQLEQTLGASAAARKAASLAKPGERADQREAHDALHADEEHSQTRDLVAPAVGMGAHTYQRAKAVVVAASNESLEPEVREVAKAALDEMDRFGKVTGPYEKVQVALGKRRSPPPADAPAPVSSSAAAVEQRRERVRELSGSSLTSDQIADELGIAGITVRQYAKQLGIEIHADKVVGNRRTVDSNRVIDAIVNNAELNSVDSLDLINWSAVDRTRVGDWVSSLDTTIRALNSLRKHLKELTQ